MAGTPGFSGERLREAREARGYTASQLAELIGVTKQAVSLYEKSKSGPGPEIFEKLTSVLNVPQHYFLRPPAPPTGNPVFYRSMASATKRMRDRAERRLDWFRQIIRYVSEYVDLPGVDVPDLNYAADPHKITAEQVEDAATAVRRHWGLGDGPISNVALLLENKGIVATRFDLEAEKLDAFSVWDSGYTGRPLVVLGADKDSAVRSRFDAAHELAHLVLHRDVPGELVRHGPTFNLIEEQAHRFARAFLLPQRTFARELVLPTLAALKPLKLKWKVAIAGIIMRATDLDLISPEQAQRLWINRTRYKWKTREPYDDELEPEKPVLIAKSISLLLESGTVSAMDMLHGTAMLPDDLEMLAGLPRGTMRGATQELTEPEPRLLPFPGLNRTPGQVS